MWRRIFSHIYDLIIPPRSTERCVAALTPEKVLRKKVPSPHTHGGTLPYHDQEVTALVWELKYYKTKTATRLAAVSVQEELVSVAAEEIGVPILIPIPMHKTRRRTRGHNQTETLAQEALRGLGHAYTYAPTALVRTRHTPSQQGLPREKRLTNVALSMRVTDPQLIRGRTCVVLDDVCTTGATLHEAKRALLEAGAQKVLCVTLAAALYD